MLGEMESQVPHLSGRAELRPCSLGDAALRGADGWPQRGLNRTGRAMAAS